LASALDIGTWGRGMKRAFLAVFFTFLEKSAIPTTAEIATNIGTAQLGDFVSHTKTHAKNYRSQNR